MSKFEYLSSGQISELEPSSNLSPSHVRFIKIHWPGEQSFGIYDREQKQHAAFRFDLSTRDRALELAIEDPKWAQNLIWNADNGRWSPG